MTTQDLTLAELDALEKAATQAVEIGPTIGFKFYLDSTTYLDPATILRLCAMARKGMGE
jgi:hypothetical protein